MNNSPQILKTKEWLWFWLIVSLLVVVLFLGVCLGHGVRFSLHESEVKGKFSQNEYSVIPLKSFQTCVSFFFCGT